MKQWMKQPAFVVLLVAGLILVGVFVGHGVLAQRPEPVADDRVEGAEGKTGQILGLTPEQLPALQPADRTPLYHFSGALNNNSTTPEKATVVQCTNVDQADATWVEVQLYDWDALDVFTATVYASPFRTVTFESIPIAHYYADIFINAGTVDQGYGRILAEHSNVICTVQTLDPGSSPPNWNFDIPVYSQGFGGAFLPAIMKNATP